MDAELEWREWTDPNGHRRESVTLRAGQVVFEGVRRTTSQPPENADGSAGATSGPGMNAASAAESESVPIPGDLPF